MSSVSEVELIGRLLRYMEENPKLVEFLIKVLDENIEVLEPTITSSGVTYPSVGASDVELEEFRRPLSELGIMKYETVGTVFSCPACRSPLFTFPKCPICGSLKVVNVTLISHPACGFTGALKDYRKGHKLVCPRCGLEVTEEQLQFYGRTFECEDCGARFDRPELHFYCGNCGAFVKKDDVLLIAARKYVIDRKYYPVVAKAIIIREISLNAPIEGFEVKLFGKVKGRSGTEHSFDVVLTKKVDSDVWIGVVQIAVGTPEQINEIIDLVLTKYIDLEGIVHAFSILVYGSTGRRTLPEKINFVMLPSFKEVKSLVKDFYKDAKRSVERFIKARKQKVEAGTEL